MQKKIVEKVNYSEVRNFSNQYQKFALFGAEMEVAQIVITPKVSDVENKK
jgi:peptidyl-prolyl cis-trans isomerase SurA